MYIRPQPNVLESLFAYLCAGSYLARFSMYKALGGYVSCAWRPAMLVHMLRKLAPRVVGLHFEVQLHVTEDS